MNSSIKNSYAVILAGGIGSRFWPKSREATPKQYLSLVDDGTLIQNTTARLQGLFSKETIFIVSTINQKRLLHEQLPWLPLEHIFFEPFGRNTAPAIGLAAVHILDKDPSAVLVVLPADHRVTNRKLFLETLRTALHLAFAEKDALITLGLKPSYPATGYGYIESGAMRERDTFRVNRFTEKPNQSTAEKFLKSGNFYWNSGIFIWRAATILQEIQRHMPELYAGLIEIQSALHTNELASVCEKVYTSIKSQSIDYGIMEKAKNVYMVRSDFGWSDLGTWEEVYNASPKDENDNVIKGRPLLRDVKNSYIEVNDRTVSIIGLENIIVVDQPDALLICKKELSQDVRWVTKERQNPNEKNAF